MHMGMVLQCSGPGVEDGEYAEFATYIFGIKTDCAGCTVGDAL